MFAVACAPAGGSVSTAPRKRTAVPEAPTSRSADTVSASASPDRAGATSASAIRYVPYSLTFTALKLL